MEKGKQVLCTEFEGSKLLGFNHLSVLGLRVEAEMQYTLPTR